MYYQGGDLMKKDRNKLSEILTAVLMKNNANSKLRKTIEEELENKFRAGIVNDIYNLRRQTKFLSEEELYLITNSLYNNFELLNKKTDITKDLIDPKNWFTDNEIRSANEINVENKSTEEDVYFILHNVDEIKEGVWISSHETIQNLVDNWNRGAILYNPETQRKGEIKFVLGETVKVPKLVDKNVNDIAKAMLEDEYYMDMITLNIQDFGGEEKQYIEYNQKDRVLRVKVTPVSSISLLDGMHRISAAKKALTVNPELQEYLSVRILSLPVEKAQQSILQAQRSTPLDEETIKLFDKKNPYVQVAEKLNNYGSAVTNSMYHKLTDSIEEVNFNQKYCLFSNISNGLEDNFSDIIPNFNPYKLEKFSRYLVDFYNVFLGMFDNYFSDLESTKKDKVIADINIFTGLLTIARKLYEVSDWQSILENVLENIVWDRTNANWTLTNSLNWNKPTKTKIYGYFNNLMSEKVGVM